MLELNMNSVFNDTIVKSVLKCYWYYRGFCTVMTKK